MAKFHEAVPPGSKVVVANMLHFKPIFDPPWKRTVRGATVCGGGCASINNWSFSIACKNMGAQHHLFDLQISKVTSLNFTGLVSPNTEKLTSIKYLIDFEYLQPFWRYSPPKFEVVQNRAKFCTFLAPKIF